MVLEQTRLSTTIYYWPTNSLLHSLPCNNQYIVACMLFTASSQPFVWCQRMRRGMHSWDLGSRRYCVVGWALGLHALYLHTVHLYKVYLYLLMCIRGTRSAFAKPIFEGNLTLAAAEGQTPREELWTLCVHVYRYHYIFLFSFKKKKKKVIYTQCIYTHKCNSPPIAHAFQPRKWHNMPSERAHFELPEIGPSKPKFWPSKDTTFKQWNMPNNNYSAWT